jgi:hypothetical protein
MVLRIQSTFPDGSEVFRISGDVQADQLDELRQVIGREELGSALDLGDVSLVDVEAVRFLGACEAKGMILLRCPAYIREWINRERTT